jgi:anaerobic selenocysteine-containing dehydrogenase
MSPADETRQVRTFCRVCEPACGLVAEVEAGEIRRLQPDREHPVSRGFACHKGLATLDIHRDPDRLGHPQRRVAGGGFEDVSWDTATSEIAGELERIRNAHGPDAIAAYLGNPLAFNALAAPATGSFLAQLGTRRVFSSGTQDCANKFAGSEAVFGTSTLHPIPDIEHTDHLLVFGSNPRVSHMSFLSIADPVGALRTARERGATVRFINPRRIEEPGANVGEVVLIRPDTDLYLMAAMLCEIDATIGFREDVARAHGRNLEGLRAFVRRYPAERVAEVTGISAEQIRTMAREFAQARSAAVYMSTGVNMGRQGTLAYWLLFMLSFVTGNLDRRGGNVYSLGFYPAAKAGRVKPVLNMSDTPYGPIRRSRGALPGNLLADMILAKDNPVRALIVTAGNPLLSIGGGSLLREAFEQLELLVVVDLYRNATAELAHYVLPAADMLERRDLNLCGLGMQHEPYVQYTDAVVAPRDERREEWWIFARLEQQLGLKSVLDGDGVPSLFGRLDHMMRGVGVSIEELAARPGGTAVLPPLDPGRFYDDWIQTEDQRVDCCPAIFDESQALARAEQIFVELAAEPAGTLKLITRRDARMHNSWYQNVERLRRGKDGRNPLYIHPSDAAARGLEEGARARLSNEVGAIDVELAFDAGLARGVVAMAHGGGNAESTGMQVARRYPGANPNALLPRGPGSFEPLSNQAFMTGIPVSLDALALGSSQ